MVKEKANIITFPNLTSLVGKAISYHGQINLGRCPEVCREQRVPCVVIAPRRDYASVAVDTEAAGYAIPAKCREQMTDLAGQFGIKRWTGGLYTMQFSDVPKHQVDEFARELYFIALDYRPD